MSISELIHYNKYNNEPAGEAFYTYNALTDNSILEYPTEDRLPNIIGYIEQLSGYLIKNRDEKELKLTLWSLREEARCLIESIDGDETDYLDRLALAKTIENAMDEMDKIKASRVIRKTAKWVKDNKVVAKSLAKRGIYLDDEEDEGEKAWNESTPTLRKIALKETEESVRRIMKAKEELHDIYGHITDSEEDEVEAIHKEGSLKLEDCLKEHGNVLQDMVDQLSSVQQKIDDFKAEYNGWEMDKLRHRLERKLIGDGKSNITVSGMPAMIRPPWGTLN